MKGIVLKSVMLALLMSIVVVKPAAAYFDPNTGGIIFQTLATGLALFSGVALIFSRQIRMIFARFMRFVRGLFGRESQDSLEQDQPESDSPDLE